jgi:hypothetical protein
MKRISILALALAGALCHPGAAGAQSTLAEDFVSDPLQDGWKFFGDTNLFQWNPTNQNLSVTWDSAQVNSYFYHPLSTILTTNDAFSVAFDLTLNDATAIGSFELAVGLLNFADATNSNFSRPVAVVPNIFEFDYFPDGGYGPSIDATLSDATVSDSNTTDFYFAYADEPLTVGTTYHIILTHNVGQAGISGQVSTNGQIYTILPDSYPGPISELRLDTVAISSYSAASDTFGDSILAHGTVDNLVVSLPPLPVRNFSGGLAAGAWQGQFLSRSHWTYRVQSSIDLETWSNALPDIPGTAGVVNWQDATTAPHKFYRISATPLN